MPRCKFEWIGDVISCTVCEVPMPQEFMSKPHLVKKYGERLHMIRRPCPATRLGIPRDLPEAPPAVIGPGTDLYDIWTEVKVVPKGGCGCKDLMNQMNVLGIEGCLNPQNKKHVCKKIRRKLIDWGYAKQIMKVGWFAWQQGKKLTIGGMYDMAVQRSIDRRDRMLAASHEICTI